MPYRCRLVLDLAQGAAHLHAMGIVHRDIKPTNLLVFNVPENGLQGKLADFGFAKGKNCRPFRQRLCFTPCEPVCFL
ncbi:unnamed protein product [Hapterophycus canaliculatus]